MNGHPVATRGIVLLLCLRTPDSGGTPAAVSWTPDSPAAALAADVIAASGGAPDALQGAVQPCRFFNLQSALLAARRMQWAFEGLGETARQAVSASMAIYSLQDSGSVSTIPDLESLAPGQVLLSAEMARAVHQLPGLAVNPAATGSWRALQWQSQNAPAGLEADEQSVLGLIRGLGREDPCPTPRQQQPPARGRFPPAWADR